VDRDAIGGWWLGLVASMPTTVLGLRFGLVEPAGADGASARHLYVAGCPSFDPDDESAEWATRYCWWPEGRYVLIPGLAALDEREPAVVLEHAAELIRRSTPTPCPACMALPPASTTAIFCWSRRESDAIRGTSVRFARPAVWVRAVQRRASVSAGSGWVGGG
jgi:hypothetical protein